MFNISLSFQVFKSEYIINSVMIFIRCNLFNINLNNISYKQDKIISMSIHILLWPFFFKIYLIGFVSSNKIFHYIQMDFNYGLNNLI
jgi:hypothetical protein